MSNRQSNIIFYSVIFLIISTLVVKHYYPDIFDNFTKSEEQISIKQAMSTGEYNKALSGYKILVNDNISQNKENTIETADLYEEMANIYLLLGNKKSEIDFYLKSLAIKKQLKKVDIYSFSKTYYKLGSLAEDDKKYNQAQSYYEKSLMTRIGNIEEPKEDDEGMFVNMQQSRIKYLILNHEDTIATYKKLGSIHNIKNEYALAKQYYEKALLASQNTFGEDDVKTLELINLIKQLTR
ncbi:MAG: tetratricopeptide repeat protein [Gammaproteobacteria bacterium]|nr:tetratricopeptide repeat protein [Gammaproteobacteria bacterium]